MAIKPKIASLLKKNYFTELEFLAEWWSSSTCTIYTDDKTWAKMGSEHAILLLNHSYEVDWLFSWFICENIRMLGVSISILCTAYFIK